LRFLLFAQHHLIYGEFLAHTREMETNEDVERLKSTVKDLSRQARTSQERAERAEREIQTAKAEGVKEFMASPEFASAGARMGGQLVFLAVQYCRRICRRFYKLRDRSALDVDKVYKKVTHSMAEKKTILSDDDSSGEDDPDDEGPVEEELFLDGGDNLEANWRRGGPPSPGGGGLGLCT
jgi:hypothetical protein